jgi:uncharacterized membrane protein (UPF0127 family)
MRLCFPVAALCLALLACSSDENVVTEVGVRLVGLPNGDKVRAEVMQTQIDMTRGMMFRKSLDRGRGMLFVHGKPGPYTYWMYNVEIPLDLIFIDAGHRVVYIEHAAPPCRTAASQCPQYGPNPPRPVQYVLELGGGEAKRYGLKPGDALTF